MSQLNKIASAFVVIIVLVVLLLSGARLCVLRVSVGEIGVRTDVWTGGLVQEDFGPGWHRDFGPMHNWALFNATVQTLEMSQNRHHKEKGWTTLTLKSADGYSVDLDVTVKYRIKTGEAHKLLQKKGEGDKYKDTFIQNALDACRISFGQMNTEDFYNPETKVAKSEEAKKILQTLVDSLSVEVIDILIRDVRFDPSYERKIRDRKLADQDALLNQSKAKAAEQKGVTDTISAATEALVQEIGAEKKGKLVELQADLEATLAEIRAKAVKFESEKKSEADLYRAEKEAEGNLLLKISEAEGERLRNEALAGTGGKIMSALEAAKNLSLGDITVSTQQHDFLDIDQMLKKFGLSEEDFKVEEKP
jgi:regulator of protease activity HflC (stomatin/prohibitin superfamily)